MAFVCIQGLPLSSQNLSSFQHFTFLSEFPQNTVQAICQDSRGYIWVGTESGLNKYDGKRIINYKLGYNGNFSLVGKSINAIVENKAHQLWVGTDKGLTLFYPNGTPEQNKNLQAIADRINKKETGKNLECILQLSNSKMVFGYRPGMLIYDPSSEKFISQELVIRGKKVPAPFVVSLLENSKNQIVAITNRHGVMIMDDQFHVLQDFPMQLFGSDPELNLHNGILLPDNKLFIASNKGLFILSLQEGAIPKKIQDQQGLAISAMQFNCQTYDPFKNRVLSGSNSAGIFTFDTSGLLIDHLADNAGSKKLQSNNIFFLLTDKQGQGYWAGHGKGLIKFFYQEDQFFSKAVTDKDGSPMRVYPLYTEDNKNLLIGTERQLIRYNIPLNKFEQLNIGEKTEVRFNYIYRATPELLLFCTKSGIYFTDNQLTPAVKKISTRYPELSFTDTFNILCALKISDSEIVFGARGINGGGLIRWNFRTHTTDKFEHREGDSTSVCNNTINYLALSPQGDIIVCTNNGICLFNKQTGRFKQILPPGTGGISYPQVNAILPEADTWWIGTYGGGLNKYDLRTKQISYITEKEGLANNDIYAVYRGYGTQLWMSTNRGLVLYDSKSGRIRNYDQADGLVNNEFNRTSSFHKGDTMYFGGINGFNFFNPQHILQNNLAPLAEIEKTVLLKGGTEKLLFPDSLRNITLTYTENTLKFYLASPFYINPGKTIFWYRILPSQKEWLSNGTNNELILTQLQPGKHRLEVKSVSSDGVESSNISVLNIYISPPWYQTWWFRILCILAISLILFAFYKMRVNQLRNENKIRNQMASDLHDDLGSTMNSIKVYANLAMMDNQAEKYLPLVKLSTHEAISGIRDIIWVLDDTKDSIDSLLTRVGHFASNLCDASNVKYDLHLSNEAARFKLGLEERRNLYMMLKEVINNAIKYAEATVITVHAELQRGKPVFSVADNGKGFDTTKVNNGNGLKNLGRRAKEIKYRLAIDSVAGKGTTVAVGKI